MGVKSGRLSYGTEYQTALSDIDFAVLFDKKLGIAEEAAFLSRLSEILGTDRVDLVNLNKTPLNLQFRAISEGNIIYELPVITWKKSWTSTRIMP